MRLLYINLKRKRSLATQNKKHEEHNQSCNLTQQPFEKIWYKYNDIRGKLKYK